MADNGNNLAADVAGSPDPQDQRGGEANPNLLTRIVELLLPLSDSARLRTIRGALAFLGTSWEEVGVSGGLLRVPALPSRENVGSHDSAADEQALPRRAQAWLTQNSIDEKVLGAVFHRSSAGVEVIAHELPGQSNKERMQQCYLLAGLRGLLHQGEPHFSDDEARALCRTLGCYDAANHATYVKAIGNLTTGSKASGFELTMPGLRAGAEMIRRMTNGAAS